MKRHFSIIFLVAIALPLTLYLISKVELTMKNVFIVEVSDSKIPAFPDSCVVCRQPQVGQLGTIQIADEHGRLDFYFYQLTKEDRNQNFLSIPAHDACIKGVRNNFLKRFFLMVILAVSIGWIGIFYRLGLFFSAIIALLVVTPFLYWQFTEPVPVEYMHYSGKFVLIFKDRNYATDVAHLNHVNMKEGAYPSGQPVVE
jgi:hypothetical protein